MTRVRLTLPLPCIAQDGAVQISTMMGAGDGNCW